MKKIKVFLSDPQILFREGIHFTLSGEEDFEVSGEATNNEDALAAMKANPPSIAILNTRDGKIEGSEATRRIKRNLPSVSVILVTDSDNEEQLFSAMKSGASAYLTKDTSPDDLVNIVKEMGEGAQPIVEVLLKPGLAGKALVDFEAQSVLSELHHLLAHLSPGETEILKYIAEGNAIEQVAAKLSSNEEAVRHQAKLIVQKLVANDQARATIEAVQKSLPSMLSGVIQGRPSTEYITKAEFAEFKDSLMQRLKSLIGELVLSNKSK